MSNDEVDAFAHRRGITFAQAEGVEPLPRQLALREISAQVRARLAKVILESLNRDRGSSNMGGVEAWVDGKWRKILYYKHTLFDHQFPDSFSNSFKHQRGKISAILSAGSYDSVLGFIQFVLQHRECPPKLNEQVEWALRSSSAAYRVMADGLIVPIASEAEGELVAKAFDDLAAVEFNGARRHLSDAARGISNGAWADSVRDSIHAVEAVARLLEPSASTLAPALNRLANAQHVHAALKDGMNKLYGYTNDEKGIRHSLLEDGDARVDEADALYMFGACASFVSYLVAKGRSAGLVK